MLNARREKVAIIYPICHLVLLYFYYYLFTSSFLSFQFFTPFLLTVAMFDIFTIINIVSKVLDDSPSDFNAVSECRKLEPWCSCGISDDETIYKLSCNRIKDPNSMPNFTNLDLKYLSNLDFSGSYFGKSLRNNRPFNTMRITSKDVQLDLQNCALSFISESFTEVLGSSVTIWKLSHNNLKTLPSLKRLTSLQNIDLSHNRFKDVPNTLCDASSVSVVNFAHNSFHQDISGQIAAFSLCPNLHKVYWDADPKVDCSCEALKHYMFTHSKGPPFIEKETSKLVYCDRNSEIQSTRGDAVMNLDQNQVCSVCNCTQYLVSSSMHSSFPSLFAVILPLVLSFLFR